MNPYETLAVDGYLMLPNVFDSTAIESLAERLMNDLVAHPGPAVLQSRDRIYGSRNLLAASPWLAEVAAHPGLYRVLRQTLGENVGLVRGLFFDKPPDRTWSLPWHRDRTIAVKDNSQPTCTFKNPTCKAGIAHFEAPESLLNEMLTLRIHLDAMTAENGPLAIIPGSHLLDSSQESAPLVLSANAGDVLAMRPLLSHSSSMSKEGTTAHRRIVHLEFAAEKNLPDGVQWNDFLPLTVNR